MIFQVTHHIPQYVSHENQQDKCQPNQILDNRNPIKSNGNGISPDSLKNKNLGRDKRNFPSVWKLPVFFFGGRIILPKQTADMPYENQTNASEKIREMWNKVNQRNLEKIWKLVAEP